MARVLFNFFDDWSDELAWWLGLTLGDGNVHRGKKYYRVSLCGTFETTSRWLALFAPERRPMEFKNSPGTFQATVDSKQLVELCESQFGMVGPKADSLPWPVSLPKKHRRAFIRGLWDSDGSLSVDMREGRRGGPCCRAKYTTATHDFAVQLQKLVRTCIPSMSDVKVSRWTTPLGKFKTQRTWYSFVWNGLNAWRLARWLYRDAPEALRNEDKYNAYLRFEALRGEEYERRIIVERRMKKHRAENAARLAEFWSDGQPLKDGADKVCKQCGSLQLKAKGLCESCYKKEWRRCRKQVGGR